MNETDARQALAGELERFLAYCSENPDDRGAQRLGRNWIFGACRAAVAVGLMTEDESASWIQRAWLATEPTMRSTSGPVR